MANTKISALPAASAALGADVASPASYTYYRFNVTDNWGDGYMGIGGVRLYPGATIVGLFAMASDGTIWHQ